MTRLEAEVTMNEKMVDVTQAILAVMAERGGPISTRLHEAQAYARAAVEALREPTEAMVDKPDIDCWEQSYVYESQIKEIWQAMIDEILK